MTVPEPRSNGLDANARGILVLVVAVAVGLLLLAKAGDGGGTEVEAQAPGSTTTITIDDSGTTGSTTTSEAGSAGTHPHGEVKVIVLNGSGKTGAAKENTATLAEVGYQMGTPGDAAHAETTSVYYAEGFQADAKEVATTLGRPEDVVKPKPEESLGTGSDVADVVVVLGADTAPAGTSTSSTTTTTSG